MAASAHDLSVVHNAQRVVPITEEQLRRARLAVATHLPHGEVHDILQMLGIAFPPEVRVETQEAAA